MKIDSPLSSKEYLHGIRNHLSSFSDFGMERYTGIIIGRLFWVTYHSGYEWNRKITNEKNRAWGIVKDTKDGCRVYGFRTMGFLDPLMILVIFILYSTVAAACVYFRFAEGIWDSQECREFVVTMAVVVAVVTVLVVLCSGFMTSVTERGQIGKFHLLALLHHPDEPYNHLNEY